MFCFSRTLHRRRSSAINQTEKYFLVGFALLEIELGTTVAEGRMFITAFTTARKLFLC
jgi:hypothetical protein